MHNSLARHNNKKILFACISADGHFNPLTGLAKYLQSMGYDVRWYTQDYYKQKLEKLGIHHYPYVHALQINPGNFENFFPERVNYKTQLQKFKFDLEYLFIKPSANGIIDLENIYKDFQFDIMITDIFSFIIPMIKAKFGVPVIAAGIIPLMLSSKDLPPAGVGMVPASGFFGKLKQSALRWITNNIIYKRPNKLFKEVIKQHGGIASGKNVFDYLYNSADIVLQSCTPGFEYKRSDLGTNIKFAGPLLPYAGNNAQSSWFDARLLEYHKIVLVTQGTVEKDVNKLIVPTLEAFKHSAVLVVCTTGGSKTDELRAKYSQGNIIIEDFIPFSDIMKYASVYITNGGYGGVMLGIQNRLPMVVAGVHEGKNEICARVGYFKYGINLKTETPNPEQIRRAVDEVIADPVYKSNVYKLNSEFLHYNPNELCAQYVAELTSVRKSKKRKVKKMMADSHSQY
jgi:MGT family glycosyltransferase